MDACEPGPRSADPGRIGRPETPDDEHPAPAVRLLALAVLGSAALAPAAAATTITPSIFTDVRNGADGKCSLREAVIAANTNGASGGAAGECPAGDAEPDVIELGAGAYTLAIAPAPPNDGNTGDLNVIGDVTIRGAGARATTLYGAGAIRPLPADGGRSWTIPAGEVREARAVQPGWLGKRPQKASATTP